MRIKKGLKDKMRIKAKIKSILEKIKYRKTRNIENIREINYEELKRKMKQNSKVIIIDIRSPQEFAEERIRFAINIPLYELRRKISEIIPNKSSSIILYCQSGIRSKKAYKILEGLGYTNLYSLKNGLDGIK